MTQIGFDPNTLGAAAINNPGADVCSAGAECAFKLMMRPQLLGETTIQVVCLANIHRIVRPVDVAAEHVHTRDGIEHGTDRVVVEFVSRAAYASRSLSRLRSRTAPQGYQPKGRGPAMRTNRVQQGRVDDPKTRVSASS